MSPRVKADLARSLPSSQDGDRETINEQLRTINKEVKERKEQLAKHKEDMQKYQALVDNEPPEVNTDAINAQIVRLPPLQHESTWRVSDLTDSVCVVALAQRKKTTAKNEIVEEANSRKTDRDNIHHRATQIKRDVETDMRQ